MKSILTIVLLVVIMAFSTTTFPQLNSTVRSEKILDQNGLPRKNTSVQSNIPYSFSNIMTTYTYDSIRKLTEINIPNVADAYPWISADGLRLYYINGSSTDSIMFTQRANTNSYFSTPVRLPISGFDPYSCWLSKDELDIYICENDSLLYAHRNSVSLPFSRPVNISLIGIIPSVTGPSLNSAQDELFLYFFNYGIIRMSRSSPTSFTYTGDLLVPSGNSTGPAQLSKDDLTLFFSVTQGTNRLYQMTRTSTSDSFDTTTFQQIQGINDTSAFNAQPSMSDSLDWVAFVRNPYNTWDGNDLFLAHNGKISSVFNPDELPISLSVYPNPASGQITIGTSSYHSNSQISILNMTGQILITRQISEPRTVINISALPNGVYFVRLTNDRTVEVGKFVKQ